MEQAAHNLARVFDLPSPDSVEKVLQSEAWEKARDWSEKTLSPEAAPIAQPEEHDATGTDNDSDNEEPEW